jgi:GNAT superfamily N-acetyltransferase
MQVEVASRQFNLDLWSATADAGFDVRVADDGELAMVASPEFRGRVFNRVTGYRSQPNLLIRIVDWFRANETAGWIVADRPPWPDARPEYPNSILVAAPDVVRAAAVRSQARLPDGMIVREIALDEASAFADVLIEGSSIDPAEWPAWRGAIPRLVGRPDHHYYLIEAAGSPAAVANLSVRRTVGMLGMMAVLPAWRGQGLQRALIAHRAAEAARHGARLIAAGARDGSVSMTNLMTLGLTQARHLALYRVDPDSPPTT